MGLSIPIKSFENANETLNPGKYKLYFLHPGTGVPDDKKFSFDDLFIDIWFSDLTVKVISASFNAKKWQWEIVVSVEYKKDFEPTRTNPTQSGVSISVVLIGLVSLLGIALIFVKGEQIVYIPSIAIILGASVFWFKEIKGLLN